MFGSVFYVNERNKKKGNIAKQQQAAKSKHRIEKKRINNWINGIREKTGKNRKRIEKRHCICQLHMFFNVQTLFNNQNVLLCISYMWMCLYENVSVLESARCACYQWGNSFK